MTKRKRYNPPLIKKLQKNIKIIEKLQNTMKEDMGKVIYEIMKVKNHINNTLKPHMQSVMSACEKYLEYKNETEDFILFMEREKDNDEKEVAYKKSEAGPQKQTKRSRTPKTSGKSGKGI